MPRQSGQYAAHSRGISVLRQGVHQCSAVIGRRKVTEKRKRSTKTPSLWKPVVGCRVVEGVITFTSGCCGQGRCYPQSSHHDHRGDHHGRGHLPNDHHRRRHRSGTSRASEGRSAAWTPEESGLDHEPAWSLQILSVEVTQ